MSNVNKRAFVLTIADAFNEHRPKPIDLTGLLYSDWSDLVWAVFNQLNDCTLKEHSAEFLDRAMAKRNDCPY